MVIHIWYLPYFPYTFTIPYVIHFPPSPTRDRTLQPAPLCPNGAETQHHVHRDQGRSPITLKWLRDEASLKKDGDIRIHNLADYSSTPALRPHQAGAQGQLHVRRQQRGGIRAAQRSNGNSWYA
ncbi:hypothetical protein CEXT_205841 [Caerostris extrusa]|uniref:Ig-like domain-containing protein n=1 Tax=Caerostris extrusa TaxID=172846 RepID=A0AAV4NKS6_CAEEX|nr:hypothetical protein CEXT_205841 [Caerostris extrusa]